MINRKRVGSLGRRAFYTIKIMSARKSFFRSPIGRFVDTLLLVLIALALLAKICLSLNWVGALRPYTAQIHTMLFVLVGVYGLLTGLRLRHRWLGFPVGLAGLFLLVINAVIILLAGEVVSGFVVHGFWGGMMFSVCLSLAQTLVFGIIEKEEVSN